MSLIGQRMISLDESGAFKRLKHAIFKTQQRWKCKQTNAVIQQRGSDIFVLKVARTLLCLWQVQMISINFRATLL